MYINSLFLKDFRNYEEEIILFDKNVNIIYGENAQGKTNILEAIYLCATSKSHRTNNLKELININKNESHLSLNILKNDIEELIDFHIKKDSKKTISINKLPIKKLNELFGVVNIIIFSPEDLGLIKNGPTERRKFLNIELCQINPLYYYNLKNYHKTLKQRNIVLKKFGINHVNIEELEIWDMQLVKYGFKVIEYREKFIEELNPIFKKNHFKISGDKEDIDLIYEKNVKIEDFQSKLLKSRKSDIKNGVTSVGPHRDDIRFEINNIDIRKYGSQGQQRTAALSLKLSEIELIKNLIDDYPILLLDDVLSELDRNRQKFLIEHLNNIQTIITCTGIEDFLKGEIMDSKMFEINQGHIIERNNF